ncbi:MAG: hypothetical protein ACOYMA_08975 [Bacteroidia bacterium]
METRNKISTLIIGLLLFVSCEKDYFTTKEIVVPIDTSKPISFKDAVLPIFTTNCLGSGCHVSGGAPPTLEATKAYDQITLLGYVDADTPDTIYANSKLYKRMIDLVKPMPPKGKLSAGTLKALELWIQQGAKNN